MSQTNTCSGTYTSVTNDCQNFIVGDGTTGYVQICLDVNNLPSGGGSSCNPGGACSPPYNGGGWSPRIAVFDSGGNLIDQFLATSVAGDCITVPVNDGVAEIYGLCLSAGTEISWSTVDECGNSLCSGAPPPCNPPGSCDCANPCGPACGFTASPTVATVTSSCPEYEYIPELAASTTSTSCYTFTANSSVVDFNVIITSDCSGGNVTNFSFDLYMTGSCGVPVISGGLADLSMSPLIIGQSYTFCYTFTVPVGCSHTSHYPYFVGASPLNASDIKFTGRIEDRKVLLSWNSSLKSNLDHYVIESSLDGENWSHLGRYEAFNSEQKYEAIDEHPSKGMNYYKLIEVNGDNTDEVLSIISVDVGDNIEDELLKTIDLTGREVDENYEGIVIQIYRSGKARKVYRQH